MMLTTLLRSFNEHTASAMSFRWYLVHSKPAAEDVARRNLERQGYGVYLPRLLTTHQRGDVKTERTVPLFPRYLFVQIRGGSQMLAPVRSSVGVANVVRFGLEYSSVPSGIVESLRERADPFTGLHRLAGPQLSAGDSVRINAGPFQGLEGIFEREVGSDRVIVLLTLLGQQARIRISTGHVTPGCAA